VKYEDAVDIGRVRAEQAAEALHRWTGIQTTSLCVVRPAPDSDPDSTGSWKPVGKGCWREISKHTGALGSGTYHLIVVDEAGSVKACSMDRFDLQEVLELAKRLPLPVAEPGRGELWQALEQEESAREARTWVLHPDA
jgi:hypothetical protein